MLKTAYTYTIAARLAAVGPVCLALRELAQEAGLSPEIQMAVELAVCEAINNAIVHALKDHRSAAVEIEIVIEAGRLEVFVREHGREIPAGVIANIDESNLDPGLDCDVASLATSGRGLHMIDALCSEWNYHSAKGVNTFSLYF